MPLKLSIITINLNNAEGLRKTMESVLSQTSNDFEYIVIDGGSNDGSKEIILDFANQKAKKFGNKQFTWISEPDKGIFHAMNKGIQIAIGEFCQFLNSGDFLHTTEIVEKMLSSLPDCSIYYGNMLKLLPKGKIYRDTCGKGKITMFSFYRGTLNHSPALIKRCLYEKYGLYDENLKIVSDWKWYLISIGLHNEPVQYINLDVTCFNMDGISNKYPELEKQERRKVISEMIPACILADYDEHWQKIDQIIRIHRYKITKWAVWFMDRVLFKFEKIESSLKNNTNLCRSQNNKKINVITNNK